MTEKEELIAKLKERIAKDQRLIEELSGGAGEAVETAWQIEKRVMGKKKQPKMLTGVQWLDDKTGGIQRGTFINLAGGSFSGKSTLVLKILANISEYKPTCFFSFEMYEDKLINKIKHLSQKQKENIYVVQKEYRLDSVDAIIRQKAKDGVLFFAIDSRMKISVSITGKEYEKISYLSNHLSKLCQELGIIIILINQISEEDLRNGRLSLKGSGDQYYDSDMILFITVKKEKGSDEERRICFCEKDRDGEKKWRVDITDSPACVEVVYEMPNV
jgi:replicative DNA helicase